MMRFKVTLGVERKVPLFPVAVKGDEKWGETFLRAFKVTFWLRVHLKLFYH